MAANASPLKTIVIATALLLAAGGGYWWWRGTQASHGGAVAGASGAGAGKRDGGKPGGTQAVVVTLAPVVRQSAPLQLSALGTVVPSTNTVVRSMVNAQLMTVNFQEGQMVQKGQLLATLDARTAQAALLQAQGQLQRDTALLENARLDLSRYRQLLAQNSIARQQVDTQASLVHQLEGTVKYDRGVVASAQTQVDYTRITAPVSGRAGLRQVDVGNMVSTTDTNGLLTITQTNPINVNFSLPEGSMAQMQAAYNSNPQLKVQAWTRDNQKKIADGVLQAIDNQISTSTGTLNLKARFVNDQQLLFPNQFVNVRLDVGALPDAVMVPTAAIQIGKGGNYVFRANTDNTVSVVSVKTGATSGLNTVIAEGLQPGQQVVVDGLDRLRDGATFSTGGGRPVGKEGAASAAQGGANQPHRSRSGAASASVAASAA